MNQIARTFILVGLVVAILLGLHFLPKLSVGDSDLRRVNILSDVLPEVHEDDLDVMPVIPLVPATQVTQAPQAPLSPPGGDTLSQTTTEAPSGAAGMTPILDYSQGCPGGMARFYQQLACVRQLGRPVRVAYYGDSFIEGDIFTADLRELLQDEFGGCGVGWVDCASQVSGFRTTISHSYSGIREFEVVKRPFSQQNQGIAQRYFTASDGARMTYKGTKVRRHLASWERAIFYLRTSDGVTLQTLMNGDTAMIDHVEGSQNLQTVVRSVQDLQSAGDSVEQRPSISSLSYTVSNIGSATLLYGVALEPATGVVVDNFSMRGSAGYTLSQIPAATLAQFAAQRPYDLIVVHFGLNVANSRQGNYSGYIKQMGLAIDHLRQAYPQASILVVSMSDRDQRTDAGLCTMRGVEQLVAWQQLMASEHGVSFFNLFQAMGGRESMKSLVDRGLANKDYTHINFKGGRYLARFLFDAMMAGFRSYGEE